MREDRLPIYGQLENEEEPSEQYFKSRDDSARRR